MSAPSAPGNSAEGVIRVTGAFPNLQTKDRGGYQSRHAATLNVLREVFQTYAADFVGLNFDFFICSFDNPESCNALAERVAHVLTYSVSDQCLPNIHVIPDFIYGGWPEAAIASYTETAAAIRSAAQQPPLHDKIFWIGNAAMHPVREALVQMGAQYSNDMEFLAMNWRDGVPDRFVSLPDHARYSMLLDIRGAGYSGRLKLLMQAGRPVFVVERPFREFFFDHLKPFEHYMPVRADLADLPARVAEVKSNKILSERLSRGATVFADTYLTRDYALRYWRDLLLKIGRPKA